MEDDWLSRTDRADWAPGTLGASTKRWILQQLHSETVVAHIGAFPNKCTIKYPLQTTAYMKSLEFYVNYITLFCLEKEQHHSVTCSVYVCTVM
jgi:hypothetical protein